MKTKILTLLILLPIAAISAPVYFVTETGHVTEDGRDIGEVATVLLTKMVPAKVLQPVLTDAIAGQKAEAKAKRLSDFLAKAKEALNAGDLDTAKAILNPEITKVEKSEKDKKKAELDEQIAKLQDERAEIDALDKAKAPKP